MTEVVLSSCQKQALLGLTRWFTGNNSNAILQGEAGSGKTFLINAFLDSLGNRVRPLLLADTHEAVRVLKQSVGDKYEVKTICSALNLVLTPNEAKLVLKQVSEPNLEDYNLLIVDEASQLDDFKISHLLDTEMYILFVGHASQLPPVDTEQSVIDIVESPIFKKGYPQFLLETQQRHQGELYSFCKDAENVIYSRSVPDTKFCVELSDILDMLKTKPIRDKLFSGDFIFLAYTNQRVESLNDLVRVSMFGEIAKDEPFIRGDNIIMRRPTYLFESPIRNNTATIKGLSLGKKAELLATNTRGKVISVRYKEVLKVTCAEIKVSVETDEIKVGYIHYPVDTLAYEQLIARLKAEAYSCYSSERVNLWKQFHDVQNVLSIIRPSYAITVHCSQGSTIDTVVVDDSDIDCCPNISLRKKLRYVAYSRAKKNLYRLLKEHD